jgi:hypothetical protein
VFGSIQHSPWPSKATGWSGSVEAEPDLVQIGPTAAHVRDRGAGGEQETTTSHPRSLARWPNGSAESVGCRPQGNRTQGKTAAGSDRVSMAALGMLAGYRPAMMLGAAASRGPPNRMRRQRRRARRAYTTICSRAGAPGPQFWECLLARHKRVPADSPPARPSTPAILEGSRSGSVGRSWCRSTQRGLSQSHIRFDSIGRPPSGGVAVGSFEVSPILHRRHLYPPTHRQGTVDGYQGQRDLHELT